MTGDEELLAVFRAEAEEQIGRLGEALAAEPPGWDLGLLFRLAHSVKGASRLVDAKALADAAHALEDLLSKLRDGRPLDDQAIRLARDGGALVERAFAQWGKEDPSGAVEDYRAQLAPWLSPPAGAPAADPPGEIRSPAAARPAEAPNEESADTTLRIGIEKLEELTGLAAELTVAAGSVAGLRELTRELSRNLQALFNDQPKLRGHKPASDLLQLARRLGGAVDSSAVRQEKLGAELGDVVRRLRMVSIDTLRTVLSRVVRDAARARGVDAELKVSGGDTAIDRGLLSQVRDPLIQLIRNAVAHGLEPAAERRRAGKKERGRVSLDARSEGSWVEITVADDGRGLDLAALEKAAARRGVTAAAAATPEQLFELLAEAGYTTAEKPSELAGRGVGLDVVRTNVERLGGTVRATTENGRGASFQLRLPLTRLTQRCLKVRLGEDLYLLPLTQIERVFQVRRDNVAVADGQPTLECDGAAVTLSDLRAFFGHKAGDFAGRPAIVGERRGRRRAFLVDAIVGELEAVLQPLPFNLGHLPGVAGLAIDGGERVLPILDLGELLELAAPAALAGAGTAARRRRILVTDDSVTSRTLERNILAAAGYEVEVAVDGAEAWEKLRHAPPDLLITDIDMPRMGGIELTRTIRADRQLRSLPIILVTSLGQEKDRLEGADAGANAYIVKGAFDQDELLRAVARLL